MRLKIGILREGNGLGVIYKRQIVLYMYLMLYNYLNYDQTSGGLKNPNVSSSVLI